MLNGSEVNATSVQIFVACWGCQIWCLCLSKIQVNPRERKDSEIRYVSLPKHITKTNVDTRDRYSMMWTIWLGKTRRPKYGYIFIYVHELKYGLVLCFLHHQKFIYYHVQAVRNHFFLGAEKQVWTTSLNTKLFFKIKLDILGFEVYKIKKSKAWVSITCLMIFYFMIGSQFFFFKLANI